ncbi:uncharacterized protein KY384_003611 [Bacidia gigantensis]|uniref:uncharacterized protein n=1 Tax=Bacidia gigantensis TaxID=2732470 RepID=UPI001D05196E|nr:uncharacterized protein KY384_003611 [Bacidia gigantensis]KAG8531975.1 hypothetical protein KY384_003611 [Bacidia gigantensis]
MALSRGLSKAIGLGTEAYAHHKETKEAEKSAKLSSTGNIAGQLSNTQQHDALAPPATANPNTSNGPDISDDEDSHDEDEIDWIRDETQDQLGNEPHGTENANDQSVDALVAEFAQRHPPPPYTLQSATLANPVIIPQTRPGTKFRGFVRAYAPALQGCGIDESTFMDFHENMHKAVNKQGWFHVSNIAVGLSVLSYTVAVAPSVVVHATAVVVHTSIEAARRMWMAKQTNSYLDQMNEKLFKPRGLYAMIMAYKPTSSEASQLVDVNTHVASSVAQRDGHHKSSFKTSSGKTHGEAQMPDAAPLVFPKLEKAGDEEKKNAFKRSADFMSSYGDKRAQAEFHAKNPDSQLNVQPKPEFSSIFADPNHPVNKGLLPLLRGGSANPLARRGQRRGLKSARAGLMGHGDRNWGDKSEMAGKTGIEGPTGMLGSVKRKMHEDVLYLMVVPMPSEEELKAAAQLMEEAKKAGYK